MLSIPETLGILSKLSKGRDELVLKQLVLDVISSYYEGTSGSARSCGSNESTHLDMVKILARFSADKSPAIRKKVFTTARAVIYYSVDARELDSILTFAIKSLQVETDADVRFACADALGDALSFALRKDWNKIGEIMKKVQTKPMRKVHGETRTIDDVWQLVERLLVATNTTRSAATAITHANLALRAAYTHMLARCLRNLCTANALNLAGGAVRLNLEGPLATAGTENALDESNIVAQVVRWIHTIGKTKFSTGATGPVLIGGAASVAAFSVPARDAPPIDATADQNARQLTACVSAALLTHLLPFQTERGLEAVGKAVVAFLGTVIKQQQQGAAGAALQHDLATNHQVLLCFQVLGFIFARLGLALEYLDLKDQCLEVLLYFLQHPQYIVRVACAQCFRSLARAASPQIATWLSVLYKIVSLQLVEVADSQDNAVGRKSYDVDPTPYYSLHGHISALAAIVGVIPEAPCGVPSALLDDIFDVTRKLLSLAPAEGAPTASNVVHVHTLLEGGWMLLSSLIALGFEWNAARLTALFSLWRACLGKKPAAGKQRQDDVNLELKVRMKALVALRTFAQVMRFRMQMTLVQGVWTVRDTTRHSREAHTTLAR